ncbi:phosphate ABC transporter substrate-binding protein [Atopomonas sediminilitoris]|uniref:phosphate ABC transporter substrate-binding protein n=1 Tax=Atopomonas sediminilitoris TaxID=2919919 RepID=UPI001F4DA8AD|nr:phosphate ABC transporter substrate-binding protein [Atopomonas sediminilitoris]MCJ8170889.1 phosphate ABC transporter substrate-binding protein [Atopomonas sediminilitoris]
MSTLHKLALLAGLSLTGVFAHAEVAVIVNAGSSAAPDKGAVSNIFLGKDKSLKPVDQKNWGPAKESFYSGVTGKNEAQLKSYWSGLVFTGKGTPPKSVDSDAAVVSEVGGNADAIGYVDAAAINDSVKVLFTLP